MPATPVLSATPDVACQGGSNGTVTIETPVGVGYSYSLNGADFQDSTTVYTGLSAGNYTVVVQSNTINNTNCQATSSVEVESSPTNPRVVIDSLALDLVLCSNQGTQEITAQIISGLEPYVVTWTGATQSANDSLVATVAVDAAACDSVYTVQISIVDGNECEASNEYAFRIADTIAPVMVEFVDTVLLEGCDESVAPVELTTEEELTALGLVFSDECTAAGNFGIRCVADTTGSCPIVITRQYTVIDECGHESAPAIHRILINDETAPVATVAEVHDTLNACAAANAPAPATTAAELHSVGFEFADNCTADEDLVIGLTADTAGTCPTVITRHYTLTDACENTSVELTHWVVIFDSIAPVISGTAEDSIYYACDSSVLAQHPAATTVDDLLQLGFSIDELCSYDEMVVHHTVDSTDACPIHITRTYWVTDACGNESNHVNHNIFINDTTRPVWNDALTDSLLTSTNCEFVIPDFVAIAEAHATDNCTAQSAITVAQSPDAATPTTTDQDVTVTLTDVCGNTATYIVHITMPTMPEVTMMQADTAICEGQSVTLATTLTGATEPVQYSWTPADGLDATDVATVTATPAAGTYEYVVEVTDGNGCVTTDRVEVEVDTIPATPVLSQSPNVACQGDPNGSITIEAPVGLGYSYSLNNADFQDTTNVYHGLLQGQYTVVVMTDAAAACRATANIEVENDPTIPHITIDTIFTALCPNQGTQVVTAQVQNGQEPFVISWENATMDATDSLQAVVTFDAAVCDSLYSITVNLEDDNHCVTYGNYVFRVADTVAPEMAEFVDTLHLEGCDVSVAPDELTTEEELNDLGITFTDECTAAGNFIVRCSADTAGTCPIVITRQYMVVDECGHESAPAIHRILINDETAPAVTVAEVTDTINACGAESAPAVATTAAELQIIGFAFADACTADADLAVACTADTAADGCTLVLTRQYTVTDACGNTSAEMTHLIRIHDSIAPLLEGTFTVGTLFGCDTTTTLASLPAATTVAELLAIGGVTLTEACTEQDDLIVHCTADSTGLCDIVVTRTYWVEDACGNLSNTLDHVIHILDTVSPTVDVTVADTTIYYTNADCDYVDVVELPIEHFAPADCHEVSMTVTHRDTVGAPGDCQWSFVRDYRFTDECGNGPVIVSHTITVRDTMRPQVVDNLADTILYYSGSGCDVPELPRLVLTDFHVEDCRLSTIQFSVNEQDTTNNGEGCEWSYSRVYTFADDCNNTEVTIDQLVTVRDTTRPAISGTFNDLTIYRLDDCSYILPDTLTFGTMSATIDIQDCNLDVNSLTVSHSELTGDACTGTIVRTYTVSDLCGNSNSITQNIIVNDTTRPYLVQEIADSVLTSDNCEFVVPDFEAIAAMLVRDNCTPAADIVVAQSVDAGTVVTEDMDIVVTMTDACGNAATTSIHITMPSIPTMTLHQGDTAICSGESVMLPTSYSGGTEPIAFAWTPADGLDAVDADTVVATPAPGTYNYQVTLTDANGCTVTQQVTVTVDTLPAVPDLTSLPNVACHGDANGSIEVVNPVGTGYTYSLDGANFQDSPLFENLTDSAYVVTVMTQEGCLSTGNITVERSPAIPAVAIDSLDVALLLCPNQGEQIITAQILNGLAPYTVTWTGAEQSDADSLTATVSIAAASCDTVYSVTVTIVDDNECEAHNTYNFAVVDTAAPVITGVIPDDTVACPDDVPAMLADLVAVQSALVGEGVGIVDSCTAFDNLVLTSETAEFTQSCNYQIVRTYHVEDECGNIASVTHTIIVNDTIAPVIEGTLADETVVCAADFSEAVTTVPELLALLQGAPSITDNCSDDASLTLTVVTDEFTALCDGTYHRVYTVSDTCGNTTSITQNLIIHDDVAPEVMGTLPDLTIYSDSACNYVLPTAYATLDELGANGLTIGDCNLQQAFEVTHSDQVVADDCNNLVVRTYTISDSCGNSTSSSQNIYIQDTIHPWLSEAMADTLLTSTDCHFLMPDLAAIAAQLAQDNCTASDAIGVAQSIVVGTELTESTSVTVTLTDGCGLTSTYTLQVNIPDELQIVINQNDTAFCEGGEVTLPTTVTGGIEPMTFSWTPAAGLDATDVAAPVATPVEGVYDYVVTVVDANGCEATATVNVEVWETPDTATTSTMPNTICEGYYNGEIHIESPLGTQYSYSLNGGEYQDEPVFTELMAGTYTVEVRTDNGCLSGAVQVVVPNSEEMPNVAITVTDAIVCPSAGNQAVSAVVTGGEAPFVYVWQGDPVVQSADEQADIHIDPDECDTVYAFTVEVTDANNCTAMANATITARDEEAPVVEGEFATLMMEGCTIADVPIPAEGVQDFNDFGITYSDNCTAVDDIIISYEDEVSGSCPITVERTYTLTDHCGRFTTLHQTIYINDEEAPRAPVAAVTSEVSGCGVDDAPAAAQSIQELLDLGFRFTDNCTPTDELTFTLNETSSSECPVVLVREYTLYDGCQNSRTITHTINIQDTTAPVINGTLADRVVDGCSVADLGNDTLARTVADLTALGLEIVEACSYDDMQVIANEDVSGECPIVVTRTYQLRDACGNESAVLSHVIRIQDTTPPVFSNMMTSITLASETCEFLAPDFEVPVLQRVSDNCWSELTYRQSIPAGTVVTESFVMEVYVADGCGNESMSTIDVIVPDPLQASISQQDTSFCEGGSMSVDVTVTGGTVDYQYSWTPEDGLTYEDPLHVTCSPEDGIYHYEFTVVDENGCQVVLPLNVTVYETPDAPTFTVANNTMCAGDPNGSITVTAPLSEHYQYSIDGENFQSDPTFTGLGEGTYTVVILTDDGCLSPASEATVETVLSLPTVSLSRSPQVAVLCPQSSATINAQISGGTPAFTYTWTGTTTGAGIGATLMPDPDVCDTSYTVTLTVEDIYHCTATASMVIPVLDDSGPQIINLPTDTTVYNGCSVDVVPAPATTVPQLQQRFPYIMIGDNCSLTNATVTSEDVVTGECPIILDRTYWVVDHCGNVSNSLVQHIAIYDRTAPEVTATSITTTVNGCDAADAPAEITDPMTLAALGFVFHDACTPDDELTVSCTSDTSDTYCPMVITRTYSVTDRCGNTATGLVNVVEVFDSVAPVLSGDIATFVMDGCDTTALAGYPAAADAAALTALGVTIDERCSDVQVFSEYTAEGECPIVVTRTYWVVDACGNESNHLSQTIHIQDTISPTFTDTVPDQYLVGQGGLFYIPDLTDWITPIITDNCTPAEQIGISQQPAVGTQVTHDQAVTVTITDGCGNTADLDVQVILPDVLQINIVQDGARFCFGDSLVMRPVVGGGSMPYVFEWTPNDGGLSAYDTLNVTARPTPGTHMYWVVVTDFNGSTATDSITIIVDSIPATPQLTATGNTICAGDPNGSITVTDPLGVDYTYSLNGGAYQSDPTFTGLAAGTYTVTAQTPAGCTSDTAIIEVPESTDAPTIAIVPTPDTLCPNVGSHSLSATIDGGTAPFTYSWSGTGVAEANDLATTLTVDATLCHTQYAIQLDVVDANNCSTTAYDTVYVDDSVLPTIAGVLDVVTYNGCTADAAPAAVTTAAELQALGLTLDDNCTAADLLTVTSRDVVSSECPIIIERYYTVTDACGNASTEYLQTLQVFDSVAPQVTNGLVETHLNGCDESAAPTAATTPELLAILGFQFHDECNSDELLQVSHEETIDGSCPTTITRKYVVTDVCGNVSDTLTHVITVFDSVAPVISGAIADVTVDGCDTSVLRDHPMAATTEALLALGGIQVDEACSANAMTVQSEETVTPGCPITVVRTYTLTDECGNVSNEITETIYIQDVTAPTFTTQVEEHLLTATDCQFVVPNLVDEVRAVSSDNCTATDALTITQSPAEGVSVTADMTVDVTVTDSCGNSSVMTIQLRLPAEVTATINPSTTQYCEWDVVELTAAVEGGDGNYTYAWTPTTGLNITDQPTVEVSTDALNYSYSVLVTDGNGCTVTADITLPEPSHLTVTVAETDAINCFEGSDGEVTATAANGIETYTYAWSNGATTAINGGLTEGTYSVTVTDAYGCTATAEIAIEHPAELSGTVSGETAVLCFGDANGSGTIAPAGGTAPYTVTIDNGTTSYDVAEGGDYTFTGLAAGEYTVLVTDANACAFTTTLTVGTPDVLALTETANTMPLCYQGDDGTVTVNAVGGTLPYTISVDGTDYATMDAEGDQLIENLAAGTYDVAVTDANNCVTHLSVTINEPALLELANSGVVNVSCNGLSDATATVVMSGGTAPYTLWINNNEQTQTVNAIQDVTFTDLAAGTHTVTVQDANGCLTTLPVTVTEPDELTLDTADITAVLCFGDANGSVRVTPAGGTAPYTVSVDDFATTQTVQGGSDYTFTGLTAGTYTVAVRDAHNCEATVEVEIATPDALTLTEDSVSHPLCFQSVDGDITYTVNGGVAPYTMTLDGTVHSTDLSAGTHDVAGLATGDHTIVIVDANGCQISITSTLVEPALLVASQAAITPITCHDGDDGTVTVSIAGGTAPYDVWIDASLQTQTVATDAETALFTGMNGGVHVVTVVDAHHCTSTLEVSFVNPDPMGTVVDTLTHVLCFGQTNGTATITITGGTLPYQLDLDSVPVTTLQTEDPYTLTGLAAGAYTVNIVDDHGCTASLQFEIEEPDTLTAEARVVNNVFCFGNSDGNATATAEGGRIPYHFAWDEDHQTADLNNVPAGFYVVTVSDISGCIATDTAFVEEPEMLTVELVTVTESCDGEETAVIDIDAHGGTPDYQYSWSNGANTDSIFNLAVGPYTVTVTDANGCRDTLTVEVPFHALPNFTVSVTDAYCDRADGTATVVGEGTELYNYDWHAESNPNAPFNGALAGGDYVLTVDDGVCTLNLPFTIDNIPGPWANFTADPTYFIEGATVHYFDASMGSIVSWHYDFGDGYSYDSRAALHQFNEAGEYVTVLTVTDEHNCIDTAAVTITVIPDVIIYAPNAFTPNEDGVNDVWMPVLSNYSNDAYELYIYNRWGQLVFKSNEVQAGWNGLVNGKNAPSEVYTYVITYYNLLGKKMIQKGTITLIR